MPNIFSEQNNSRSQAMKLVAAVYAIAAFCWLFAAMIRLTVRDLSPSSLLTVLYYATPGVLLFISAFLLMFLALLLRKQRACATWCMLSMIVVQCAGTQQASQDFSFSQTESSHSQISPKTYRLLTWNLSHGDCGWEKIAKELAVHQADVIALVEAGEPTELMRTFWQKNFPGYDISLLGNEMILMTRGKSTAVRAKKIGRQGELREVDLILDQHKMTAMVVDIHGRPDLSRKEAIQDLAEIIASQQKHALLIAGDFNTPSESPLFQPLRKQAFNAFETAGAGYAPTWPCPYPVLVLDQLWGNQKIHFTNCQTIWSKASDHCAVITEFTFREPNLVTNKQ